METIKTALFGVGGLLKVRALLAFIWSGATIYLFVSGDAVPETLLVINTGIVTYYFATRTAEGAS